VPHTSRAWTMAMVQARPGTPVSHTAPHPFGGPAPETQICARQKTNVKGRVAVQNN